MNRVAVQKVPEPDATRYPLGTLIEIEDSERGQPGGVYMLVAAGTADNAAVLANLSHGTTRNGQLHQEGPCCGVTAEVLLDNIGRRIKFHVVKRILITMED